MTPPPPEAPFHIIPIKTYFFDTDAGGIVNNVAYLRMVEVARTEFAESAGWPVSEMVSGEGGCPVVARTEIDYLRSIRLGDPVEIFMVMEALEQLRFFLAFEIREKEGGLIYARGRQTMVNVNLASGRPTRIRRAWIERWPHLLKSRRQ